MTAPVFTVSRRGPVRGRTDAPLTQVPDGVDVQATVTILTVRTRGTGSSLRAVLGVQADNQATAVATIDADAFPLVPDFLRTPGVRVRVWGTARQVPGLPAVIQVVGVAPAPECPQCSAPADASGCRIPKHEPRCPWNDPRF